MCSLNANSVSLSLLDLCAYHGSTPSANPNDICFTCWEELSAKDGFVDPTTTICGFHIDCINIAVTYSVEQQAHVCHYHSDHHA